MSEDNLSGKIGYGSGSNCSSNIVQSSNDNNNSTNLQKSVSSDDMHTTQSQYLPAIKLNSQNNYSQGNILHQQNNNDEQQQQPNNLQFHINADMSYEDQNKSVAPTIVCYLSLCRLLTTLIRP